MSACVSSEGEYSDHVTGDDFYCQRCFAHDEPAQIADRERLLARVRELEAEKADVWDAGYGQGWADKARFAVVGFPGRHLNPYRGETP